MTMNHSNQASVESECLIKQRIDGLLSYHADQSLFTDPKMLFLIACI